MVEEATHVLVHAPNGMATHYLFSIKRHVNNVAHKCEFYEFTNPPIPQNHFLTLSITTAGRSLSSLRLLSQSGNRDAKASTNKRTRATTMTNDDIHRSKKSDLKTHIRT
jgi:siroheme synthase (precorrin-2 oxidase/ferrochelatase)